MNLTQIMAKELSIVLEETTNNVSNRLIMESLFKNGKVTIEEAHFLNKLAGEIIQESAGDFIPDTINVNGRRTSTRMIQESTVSRNVQLTESENIVNNLINTLL